MSDPARTALIVGGSSGIGRVTAVQLARSGWNVVVASRSETALAAAAAECAGGPGQVLALTCDVRDRETVRQVFAAAEQRFGRLDAVVNTAAVVAYGLFSDVPAEVFDTAVTTNLLGTATVARLALEHFARHGGGNLVITGSLLGKIAVPYMSPYVTGKWGVQALARTLQIEARQTPGVQVTLVSPGSVNTPAYSQAGNYAGWEGRPPPPVDPPEKVAAAIVASLAAPRRERSVGLANHLAVFGFRFLPAVFDVLVTPLMKIGGLSRRPVPAHSGDVQTPQSTGEAGHGYWSFLGRRSDG